KVGVRGEQGLEPFVRKHARRSYGQLLASLDGDLAGVGVDHVGGRFHALHAIDVEGHAPAFLQAAVSDLAIEGPENLFVVEPQRIEQRGHGNLAAPVDTRIDDVLRVELDIEPGTAVGNDAGGEQEL